MPIQGHIQKNHGSLRESSVSTEVFIYGINHFHIREKEWVTNFVQAYMFVHLLATRVLFQPQKLRGAQRK